MNIINLRDIPAETHRSPKGTFDIELTRVLPGKAAWPLHAHAAQWEAFIVLSDPTSRAVFSLLGNNKSLDNVLFNAL